MNAAATSAAAATKTSRAGPALALTLATLAAYLATFDVPFRFDDLTAIPENGNLRQFSTAFSPPPSTTLSGRPLAHATFALNHAVSGLGPWSYHATNLAIHLLAGLTLFGLTRRTLLTPRFAAQHARHATSVALTAAALWLLHPLQTESVTYVVQRVESLMALFFLLTLYAFIRAAEVGQTRPTRWLTVSVVSCLLGMATKEVMVTAPLLVWLHDRTFVAGTFRAAWRARPRYYAALAATWLLLIWLVAGTGGRGGTAGLNTEISSWHYALTQLHALALYLKLALWPTPLIFDYGRAVITNPLAVLLPGFVVLALVGGTLWALWRRPVPGFLGAWFLLILAPTSSVVPVATQTIAEHRVYLPLAALAVAVAGGVHAWLGARARAVLLVVAATLGLLTWQRNAIYRDELRLWNDTVAKRPGNERAHYSVGATLATAGRKAEAIAAYEGALRADPDYPEAHHNLAVLLAETGRLEAALAHFASAVRTDPENAKFHHAFGTALAKAGRFTEAATEHEVALRLQPGYADAHASLASALAQLNRAGEALAHFESAQRIKPADAQTLANHGSALLHLGRTDEAIRRFEAALRLKPDFVEAHLNLGLALIQRGRLDEAAPHYAAVLRLEPNDIPARNNLAYIALQQGRPLEAASHYQAVARLAPSDPLAHYNLGVALVRAARWAEAATSLEAALKLKPDYAEARQLLLQARARSR